MSGGLSAGAPFVGLALALLVLCLIGGVVYWLAARLAGLRPRLLRCMLLALVLAVVGGLFRLAAPFLPPAGGLVLFAAYLAVSVGIIKAWLAASWPRALLVWAFHLGLYLLAALSQAALLALATH